jgi:hypothetical protein
LGFGLYKRVQDCLELGSRLRICKNDFSKCRSVQGAVRVQDLLSKVLGNQLQTWSVRFNYLSGYRIGVDLKATEVLPVLGNRGFTCGDTAG